MAAGKSTKKDRRFKIEPILHPAIQNDYYSGMTTDQLGRKYGVDFSQIARILRAMGTKMRRTGKRLYPINESAFDSPLSDAAKYWIGFILGDGCLVADYPYVFRIDLNLSVVDKEHIEKFKAFLSTTRPTHLRKRTSGFSGKDRVTLSVNSKRLFDALARYGLTPRKSLTVKVHPELSTSSDFWRGCVDADGWLCYRKKPNSETYRTPTIGLCSGSRDVIQGFSNYIYRCLSNFAPTVGKRGSIWATTVSGRRALQIVRILYDSRLPSLNRKADLARKILSWNPTTYGRFSFVTRKPCRDLSL